MSIWCNYTRAIVRQIPATLASAALRREQPSSPIDLAKARSQHDHYVEVLRGLVSQLVVLPADDSYPDCVFVEDPAVVCGNRAVVCNIGHESRRGEVSAIRDVLRDFGLTIADMTVDGSDDAKMDGGDVLFTGHEFFVGMSERTSQVLYTALTTENVGDRSPQTSWLSFFASLVASILFLDSTASL
eukprot:m.221747 g.221747  ORF g.221747 m.221747 type:complete len:186 (+) comp39965_c0_seq2:1121-1678(+)